LDISQSSTKNSKIKLPAITKLQVKMIGVGSLVGLAGAGLLYLAIRQLQKKKAKKSVKTA
jgi:hypothetical protein